MAVVVTKLTGASLFILLLTMVIMALLPKAVDMAPPAANDGPRRCGRQAAGAPGDHHAGIAPGGDRGTAVQHRPAAIGEVAAGGRSTANCPKACR